MLTVRYRGMWPGFSSEDGGLPGLIRAAADSRVRIVESTRARVDLEVCSVFPSRLGASIGLGLAVARRALRPSVDYRGTLQRIEPSPTAKRSIWFTGENLRPPPPDSGWDLTLSFESDRWPRNAYLPLWLLGTDAFGAGSHGFLGRTVGLRELTSGRAAPTSFTRRPKFACAFIRNPEPTRLTVISALNTLGQVDVFGPITGRPVPSKAETAREYRFMLCMENDLYPGYVTEKPFDAWASGCIPLWWGLDRDQTLNSDSLVNLADHDGLERFIERVDSLNSDRTALEQAWRAPLVRAIPDVSATVTRIRELL